MRASADYWIEKLALQKHVEGGYYKRTYCAGLLINQNQLPETFKGNRPVCTGIYFLLKKNQFSALHRIASDETWHFYHGNSLIIYEISPAGNLCEHILGADFEKGNQFQCTIKAGSWFGAEVQKGGEYTLAGCTVSPGFDFEDFELAGQALLLKQYPQHESIIKKLTSR